MLTFQLRKHIHDEQMKWTDQQTVLKIDDENLKMDF